MQEYSKQQLDALANIQEQIKLIYSCNTREDKEVAAAKAGKELQKIKDLFNLRDVQVNDKPLFREVLTSYAKQDDKCEVVHISLPRNVNFYQSAEITVTMKNVGETPWFGRTISALEIKPKQSLRCETKELPTTKPGETCTVRIPFLALGMRTESMITLRIFDCDVTGRHTPAFDIRPIRTNIDFAPWRFI